jgi:hypothetical protein
MVYINDMYHRTGCRLQVVLHDIARMLTHSGQQQTLSTGPDDGNLNGTRDSLLPHGLIATCHALRERVPLHPVQRVRQGSCRLGAVPLNRLLREHLDAAGVAWHAQRQSEVRAAQGSRPLVLLLLVVEGWREVNVH